MKNHHSESGSRKFRRPALAWWAGLPFWLGMLSVVGAAAAIAMDASLPAPNPNAGPASARLSEIQVNPQKSSMSVILKTDRNVKSSLTRLSKPDRVLVKMYDTVLAKDLRKIEVKHSPVEKIRAAQHNLDVWVVLDLDQAGAWERVANAGGIELRWQAEGIASAEPQAASKLFEPAVAEAEDLLALPDTGAPPMDSQNGGSYQLVDASAENLGTKSRLTLTADGLARYRVERSKNERALTVTLYGAKNRWRGFLTGLPIGPIIRANARQVQEEGQSAVKVTVNLSEAAPYLVYRDQNQIIVDFTNSSTLRGPEAGGGNLGKKVSVDLQSANLISVLRALAQEVGFDMVFTPGIKSLPNDQVEVTLSINNQAFHQVLEYILRPRQLAYQVRGNTLKIGRATEFPQDTRVFTFQNADLKDANIQASLASALTEGSGGKVVADERTNQVVVTAIPSDMERIAQTVQEMDVQPRVETRVFILGYGQVEPVAAKVRPLLSSLGSIKENPADNSLIVADLPGKLPQIAQTIKSLDTRSQQVMIEARIVEVNVSDEVQLGVDWNTALNNPTANPMIRSQSVPTAVDMVGQFTIGTLQQGIDINARITALARAGKANVISNPRIATLNNKTAVLEASQNIPYTTSSVSQGVVSTKVEYLKLPITLRVTPQITKDLQVLLNPMILEVTTVVDKAVPPNTTTRSAETQMLVPDGETIAIGGLARDEESFTDSKIPLLGEIPLLGFFFKSSVSKKNKVELVVFLTPHILE